MNTEPKNIGIVGYGLIGGSLGMALMENTVHHIIAIDNNAEVLKYCKNNGLSHEISEVNESVISKCDVLFIALYPDAIVDFFNNNSKYFKKDSIIVDLCGIKQYIGDCVSNIDSSKFHYIGAHPMAGKEKNGVKSADGSLYKGASFLICKNVNTDANALECVKELAKSVGFENIIVTDAQNHDNMITYTSQLPHVMSVAYIMQKFHSKCYGYYAGSFKDMTRVADINEKLWTQLFKHNKEVLTEQIDEYIQALENIKNCINTQDDSLYDLLLKSKHLKEWQDENYKY